MKAALRSLALPLLALSWLALAPEASAQVPLPSLDARVTDLTGTLTAAQQSSVEEKLATFERRKGSQIAVLILPTTEPEDIAQFGIRLAEKWQIGRAESDDGVILIVAKNDRAMRIEVGRGLEGVLTDALSSRIINDTIAPLFKEGDFNGGVNAGLDQMIRVIDGETLPPADPAWKREASRVHWMFMLVAGLVFAQVLYPITGRALSMLIASIGTGGVVYWLSSKGLEAGLIGVGVFLLSFFMGQQTLSQNGRNRGGRVYRDPDRWSRNSGGGFSGGGGSFGGGGASGRW